MAMQWYIVKDGQRSGPMSSAELKQLASSGMLQPDDHVWTEGLKESARASKVKGLFPGQSPQPTARQEEHPATEAALTDATTIGSRINAVDQLAANAAPTPVESPVPPAPPVKPKDDHGFVPDLPSNAIISDAATKLKSILGKAKNAALTARQKMHATPEKIQQKGGTPSVLLGAKELFSKNAQTMLSGAKRLCSTNADIHPASQTVSQPANVDSACLLQQARTNFAAGQYGLAEKTLKQLVANTPNQQEAESLLKQIGTIVEVEATYAGGHPDHVEIGEGRLRLDSLGAEFLPNDKTESLYFRISYRDIVNVLEIKRGDFPAAYLDKIASRKKVGVALKALGTIGGSVVEGMGGRVVKGVGNATGNHLGSNSPTAVKPDNRIPLFCLFNGVKHIVLFDAIADTVEEMEDRAKGFRRRSEMARGHFGKAVAEGASKSSVNVTAIAPTSTESSQSASQQKRVVGCPKCGAKLRVAQPGTIQCPQCKAKVRVPPTMFQT